MLDVQSVTRRAKREAQRVVERNDQLTLALQHLRELPGRPNGHR